MRAAGEALQHAVDALVERPPAGEQGEGIEIALQREARGQRRGGGARFDRGVEADRREPVERGEFAELGRRAAREGDDRRVRRRRRAAARACARSA